MAEEAAVIRISLQGQAATHRGLTQLNQDMRQLGTTTRLTGEEMEHTGKRGFIMNQALFTVRRGIYAGTLALSAMTVGVVAFGLKFNATMQQNMVAFTHFLGSEAAATAYLDRLYTLAATTPFEFNQLTTATKRMLAFGFSAEGAYRTMVDIGDAAAGLGTGAEGIDRMSLAFGQMLTNGRILGGELRQLSEAGISARRYLEEAGLVPKGTANIGNLHIPAAVGIEAILRGMEAEFGGFAKAQQNTFFGLLSTIHDYAQKLFGTITLPLFTKLSETILPKVVKLSQTLEEGFTAGGWQGMMANLDAFVGANGDLLWVWTQLSSIGVSLGAIIRQSVWPVIVLLAKSFAPLLLLLWPVAQALQVVADHTTILRIVITLLVTRMIILRFWTWALYTAYFVLGIAIRIYTVWTRRAIIATQLMALWEKRKLFWLTADRIATWLLVAATFAYEAALYAARVAAISLTLAMATNPFGWIAIAIGLLIIGLYLLITHWDWVKKKMVDLYTWVQSHWYVLFGLPLIGPLLLATMIIIKKFDDIKAAIQYVIDKVKDLINWFGKLKPSWSWLTPGFSLSDLDPTMGPGTGWNRTTPAMAGAPQYTTPTLRPATTEPADIGSFAGGYDAVPLQVVVPLHINGKPIAEAVADYNLYKEARR